MLTTSRNEFECSPLWEGKQVHDQLMQMQMRAHRWMKLYFSHQVAFLYTQRLPPMGISSFSSLLSSSFVQVSCLSSVVPVTPTGFSFILEASFNISNVKVNL